jgi:hypothetical protein
MPGGLSVPMKAAKPKAGQTGSQKAPSGDISLWLCWLGAQVRGWQNIFRRSSHIFLFENPKFASNTIHEQTPP